ncbi:MMPL family transporter [Mycobacterium deserti]|uniref:MMPL family transporter n=1 Tax=Mycobacterium deserti TaxID=2978347 RepID=A0ABT2MAF8_9MYCO|nr:MMPL family transporter [Mycobacterium deserti]MCT7659258.1 MMPL family transporter [Mycobacterium deserti]
MLATSLVIVGALAVIGAPVSQKLSTAGLADPGAESTKVVHALSESFGLGDSQLVLLVRAEDGIDTPTGRAFVDGLVTELRAAEHVATVASPWDSLDPVAAGTMSRDRHSVIVTAGIEGGETQSAVNAAELGARFRGDHAGGFTVAAGGTGIASAEINEQTRRDLEISEAIAIPLSFTVLVWVFGGLLAAAIPLSVGCTAIVGSMAILRMIATFTDVSVFALNVAAGIGLALAIDYSLLIVSRWREELRAGAGAEVAIRRTMQTAGRTVVFSAVTVGLCLAPMALFPMYALRSLAYGGVAVVAFAALASLVVAPAAILVTSKRIAKRRGRHRSPAGVWHRWARTVMRHPWIALLGTMVPLLTIASPVLDAKIGLPDERILPSSFAARQVGDQIHENFNQDLAATVHIVVPATEHLGEVALNSYAAELSALPEVVAVDTGSQTFTSGTAAGPARESSSTSGDGNVLLTVATRVTPLSSESAALLDDLRAVPPPATVWFGGLEQTNRDSIAGIVDRLPLVLAAIAAVMLMLLFIMTGSVVVPVKALLLNLLSLSATFGAMVWVFQEGHLGGLGTNAAGSLFAIVPVLMFCITFGLSMDYEVFLISRIRECWLASDRTRAANDEAVMLGLASTGRVVTAAAVIMIINFAALIASQVPLMRMFGVGLTLAILLDATVIRIVLLPASMTLLGRWNWWGPRSSRPPRRGRIDIPLREKAAVEVLQ